MKIQKPNIQFCKKCVFPSIGVITSSITPDGECTGCKVSDEKKIIDWDKRFLQLKKLIRKQKNNYDCLIPVSGGKDSYFQTHIIKNVLKLNP